MEFTKYQHIERLGTDATDGILDGKVYIFSKLDGTCCGIFKDADGQVRVNSRNRLLGIGNDNHGCCAYVLGNYKYSQYLEKHPNHYLYAEWLVPHTVKCYEDDAWNKLYIFDVVEYDENGNKRYLSYEEYAPLLQEFDIEFIPVTAIKENPTIEEVTALQGDGKFLVKDGGTAEGIVIKRYDFVNKYGHTIWAKVVQKQVQLTHHLHKTITTDSIEQAIIDDLCTSMFVEKEFEKFKEENGGWNSKLIPKFLGIIWHTFIVEECWNIIRKYKSPKIDFKLLNKLFIEKVKEIKNNLF